MKLQTPTHNDSPETGACQVELQKIGRLERAVQGSNEGLWEWDVRTDEVWYASGFAQLLGFESSEFPGVLESWKQRLHPDDLQPTWDAMQRHLRFEEPYDVEYRLQTKEGKFRWFRSRGAAYRDADGQPTYMAGTIQDVESIKRTKKMLKEKEAQLLQQQKMEAVGSLAGGIAHEFNNLLQVICGYTSFAQETLSVDSQPYSDLKQVLTAADRATQLTRQLLDFSRSVEADSRPCVVDKIIRDLAMLLRPVLTENIRFHFQLDTPHSLVHVDPQLIQQALLNLCINARDAMPQGGKLLVRSKCITITELAAEGYAHNILPGRYVRLSITDTGTGIPPELQQRIFEPFFTTKEVGKGTGLGLAMAFGIIQQNEGHMELHSELGHGTTFHIYLPICKDHSMDKNPLPPICRGNGETLLLAEDDLLVREVGLRMLERAGYQVITACTGDEALDLYVIHAQQIDLIVLDVVMPGLTGREVLKHIRLLPSSVPICFCTGYDPAASQSDSLRSLGYEVIEKPFDEAHLLTTVRAILDRTQASLEAIG